jgi:hypothetical protein
VSEDIDVGELMLDFQFLDGKCSVRQNCLFICYTT